MNLRTALEDLAKRWNSGGILAPFHLSDQHQAVFKAATRTALDACAKELRDLLQREQLARSDELERPSDVGSKFVLGRVRQSFYFCQRDERRSRIALIEALTLELEQVKKVSHYSIALVRGMLEDVIDGDWERFHDAIDIFRWKLDGTEDTETRELLERHRPLWQKFVSICDRAVVDARTRAACRKIDSVAQGGEA